MENIEIINGVKTTIDGIFETCDAPEAVAMAVEKDLRDTVAAYIDDFWVYECWQGHFRLESDGVYKSEHTLFYSDDGSSTGYSLDDLAEYPYEVEFEIRVFVEDDDDGARHVSGIRAEAVIRDVPRI